MTNEDGTEDNHRRGIDDPNKETKALLARGALRTGSGTRLGVDENGEPKRARALARSRARPAGQGQDGGEHDRGTIPLQAGPVVAQAGPFEA